MKELTFYTGRIVCFIDRLLNISKIVLVTLLCLGLSACASQLGHSGYEYLSGTYYNIEIYVLAAPFLVYLVLQMSVNSFPIKAHNTLLHASAYVVLNYFSYQVLAFFTTADILPVYTLHTLNAYACCVFISLLFRSEETKAEAVGEAHQTKGNKISILIITCFMAGGMSTMFNEGREVCNELGRSLTRLEKVDNLVFRIASDRHSDPGSLDLQRYVDSMFLQHADQVNAGNFRDAIEEIPFEVHDESRLRKLFYLSVAKKIYSGHSYERLRVNVPATNSVGKMYKLGFFVDNCGNVSTASYPQE